MAMSAPEPSETFISHLIELRTRLVRSIIAVLIVFVCLFPFAKEIYALLAAPLLASLPAGGQMIATDVTTPFFVPMKVAMMTAFLIALPYVLYQVWAFVAPGLYSHEKKLGAPLVAASTLLFLCGMSFAYFLVFPVVFGFVTSVAPEGVAVMTDINKYLDFVITLFLAFGITFEVPVAVVLLVKMGIVSVEKLKEIRSYVIVGAFVIGAIFTPPDVISQIMLAVPLWLLYEVGILVASMLSKPAAAEEAEPYRPMDDAEMERELDSIEAKQQDKAE
jgi:sec-independent protein translocase protein TatC